MHTQPLGNSGIDASAIAFGAWAIGGWMWGGTDEDDAISAIHASLDAGVNFIDTAPIYGLGLSEQIAGKAIHDRRENVILATKCGMVCNPERGEFKVAAHSLGPDEHGHLRVNIWLSPESIREEVEASLKRLNTDYIDLYQTHWQESTTPVAETMGELMRLKEEGKIRAIGVCNASVPEMSEYRDAGQLDCDQERYSMLDRELENEQLPYCAKNDVAVLAYSPMALGLLTGKIGPDRTFGPGDLRNEHPRFSRENRERVMNMLDQFRPVTEKHGLTIAQTVIAWTLRQPGLTHALCGARTPEQARENAKAGTVTLSEEDLSLMTNAVDEYAAAVTV